MSNFTFFHNVFYAICILKSFKSHISVVVCSFFEFGTVSKWCFRERVKSLGNALISDSYSGIYSCISCCNDSQVFIKMKANYMEEVINCEKTYWKFILSEYMYGQNLKSYFDFALFSPYPNRSIEYMGFSTVFKNISVISRWAEHLSILSWSSFNPFPHNDTF